METETIQVIGLLITVVVAAGAAVWRLSNAMHNMEHRLSERIREEISPLKKAEGSIVRAIVELQTMLQARFKDAKISNVLETSGSPLRPTAVGERYIRESGLEGILDEHREFLSQKLRGLLPQDYTEYDVQEKARELLVSLKDDPMMNPVKRWVYNNPLDIESVLRTGGLWLRDDFLGQPRQVAPTPEQQ